MTSEKKTIFQGNVKIINENELTKTGHTFFELENQISILSGKEDQKGP